MNKIDSHTHLLDYSDEQIKQILEDSKKYNIKKIASNCCKESDFPKMDNLLKIYSQDQYIIPFYGLHPWWVNERSQNWLDNLRQKLQENVNYQVGEIGTDQFKYQITPKEEQIQVFEEQLKLAIEFNRIVTVHSVRTHKETLEIFKKYFKQDKKTQNQINVIMHSYGGNKEMTKQYLKLNANIYFSFSHGILTKQEFAQPIPLERLLIETDSPHQLDEKAVQSHQLFGENDLLDNLNNDLPQIKKLNQPKYCHILIEFFAQIYNKNGKEIAEILYNNSLKAFKLIH